MSTPSPWMYFSKEELTCNCGCGRMEMEPDYMAKLVFIRRLYGRPMVVTSGYRCPEYNETISSTGSTGPHTTGRAVDIRVNGENALDLLFLAKDRGMSGFGLKQHGPHKDRFIHLDDLGPLGQPRPWIWSYK